MWAASSSGCFTLYASVPIGPMSDLSFAILSCSLDPESRSFLLASESQRYLSAAGHHVTLIDLRDCPLPAFDDHRVYEDKGLLALKEIIRAASGVLLAVPVYNWAVGSAAKNLIEATGAEDASRGLSSPWFDQLVTFLVSGGLPHSYTAHTSLASSLMLDFKCVINPYHVYTTARDWEGARLGEKAAGKLEKTLQVKVELAGRLRSRTYHSHWDV